MQLPFRNSKHDILVDEPGLGPISGCRLNVKVLVSSSICCLTPRSFSSCTQSQRQCRHRMHARAFA